MTLNRRRVGIGMALGLSGLALVPLIVTRVENHQAGETARLLPQDKSAGPSPRRTAVVFFSRSGNTALLSRHLARRLDASLFRLEASDYDLGFIGWVNAMRDAGNHEAAISPRTIDLAGHDAVYLGAPIWMYSPAPPIWQFVEHHRFDGQRVVLFNTFNSRFKPEYVETFREKVLQRGARAFEHQFIWRGRMGRQRSPHEMLAAFDSAWAPTTAN
jgi:flavodoxin